MPWVCHEQPWEGNSHGGYIQGLKKEQAETAVLLYNRLDSCTKSTTFNKIMSYKSAVGYRPRRYNLA